MATPAIVVSGIGKQYKRGLERARYKTLRDAIVNAVKAPLRRFKSLGGVSSRDELFWALKDVSFEVQPGEVVGLIGRNGAGKSTLLKILSRITEPTEGEVRMRGRVGCLLEVGTGFHAELTGRENIYLNGAILGMKKAEIDRKFDEIVAFAEVEKFLDTPVKHYSSGMYVRLGFAVAANLEPDILLVDEVLAVGDVEFQKKCLGKIGEVAGQGRTVIFVSHNMAAIQNLCGRVLLLTGGTLAFGGDTNRGIGYYLQGTLGDGFGGTLLRNRKDRKGNGAVRFTSYRIEDTNGRPLEELVSGQDVVFVFGYECAPGSSPGKVDVGFSFDAENRESVFSFYSSYMGRTFDRLPPTGEFRCTVRRFPVAPGRYLVGARVTVLGEEADWLPDGVAYVKVTPGDFYGTGSRGFLGRAYILVDGRWEMSAG